MALEVHFYTYRLTNKVSRITFHAKKKSFLSKRNDRLATFSFDNLYHVINVEIVKTVNPRLTRSAGDSYLVPTDTEILVLSAQDFTVLPGTSVAVVTSLKVKVEH